MFLITDHQNIGCVDHNEILLKGDAAAITDAEKKGYATFKEVGCTACHMGVNVGGAMYQKMGLVNDYFAARGTEITDADLGRYNVTKRDSRGGYGWTLDPGLETSRYWAQLGDS